MGKIKVLQIGVGNFGEGWARYVIPACSDIVDFVGIVDHNVQKLSSFEGVAPLYQHLEDAIDATNPDLVVNVTPPDAHTPLNVMLLKRGLAVLCEKPLAVKDEDADSLEQLLNDTHGFLMIGENYRYKTVLRAFRSQIASGKYGPMRRLSCSFRRSHPDMSMLYHGRMSHPLLEDVTVHHLDVARYLSGSEPLDVWCREYPAQYTWYGTKPASAVIVSNMTHDIVFTYEGTLASAASITDWNGFWYAECDGAVLMLENSVIKIVTEQGSEELAAFNPNEDSRIQELREACQAISEGRKGETDFYDNVKSFRWMRCAIRSSMEHDIIRIGRE